MRQPGPAIRRLAPVTALLLGYCLAIGLWQILRRSSALSWWPLQLADLFGVWLYLPVPVLVLLALLRRRRLAGAVLLLPLLAFAWEYGALFLPQPAPEPGLQLRVMTWNLRYTNLDAPRFAARMRAEQPDVIAVQELGAEMGPLLAEALREAYPFQAVYPGAGTEGMAIFSRYPIREAPPPQMNVTECRCQQATIMLQGRPIRLINVHPGTPAIDYRRLGRLPLPVHFSTARQQPVLDAILQLVSSSPGPLLVVGDFNTGDRQANYWRLRQHLHDAFRQAGWGLGHTFPSEPKLGPLPPLPMVRIDYIFHDHSWAASRAWVGSLQGSDHRYVLAHLVLQ